MDKKKFNRRNKDNFNGCPTNADNVATQHKETVENTENEADDVVVATVEDDVEDIPDEQIERLEQKVTDLNAALEEEKKKYLYLYAEFDNFRKRTIKEKAELIRNGGEAAFKGLLPIIDDFERGLDAVEKTGGDAEGLELIYSKFVKYLEQNGVKPFDESDDTFDADRHEAITAIDVPEEKKGKIIDTVQKGYTIHGDKVLRHAKVVVGK